ncbi:WGR domain-containing protein [Microvirga aerophila]|uniref:WGR domain-containing protein n=1 Tax=Microvirga aerophila TaxID=670291 RepID=A0A512C3M4_9HYPH|nr:WGR domain-containing protein [Microvirga aerophila]GEO18647.1 hypothetical protein MAE02_63430 [Microvirga aerophila]
MLHRIDPEQGVCRFYSLMTAGSIERDLFGSVVPVRNWGRIGANGQELVEIHPDEIAAGQALEVAAWTKRRGYRDLSIPLMPLDGIATIAPQDELRQGPNDLTFNPGSPRPAT